MQHVIILVSEGSGCLDLFHSFLCRFRISEQTRKKNSGGSSKPNCSTSYSLCVAAICYISLLIKHARLAISYSQTCVCKRPSLSDIVVLSPVQTCRQMRYTGSGVTEYLFLGGPKGGGGGADLRRGVGARGRHRNDFFLHHVYCAQSKVEWEKGAMGGIL